MFGAGEMESFVSNTCHILSPVPQSLRFNDLILGARKFSSYIHHAKERITLELISKLVSAIITILRPRTRPCEDLWRRIIPENATPSSDWVSPQRIPPSSLNKYLKINADAFGKRIILSSNHEMLDVISSCRNAGVHKIVKLRSGHECESERSALQRIRRCASEKV